MTYIGQGLCEEYELTPTTRIEFHCGTGNDSIDGIKIIHDSECELAISFPTDLMCHETESIDCTVYYEKLKKSIDLSPLSRGSGNYIVNHYDETNEVHQYVLNVCRSVTHQKGILCPPGAAACEKFGSKNTTEMTFKTIGLLSDDSFKVDPTTDDPNAIENNDYEIVMTMVADNQCEGSSEKKKTIIKFVCDKSAVVSDPYFGSDDGCTVIFMWKTAYACVVTEEASNDCKVKDPITGYAFDMNSLETSIVTDPETEITYHVGVCQAALGCADDAAACMVKSGVEHSLGSVSKQLTHSNGGLSLTYQNGETCNLKQNTNYTSILRFHCDKAFSGNTDISLLASTDGGCVNHFTVRTEKGTGFIFYLNF